MSLTSTVEDLFGGSNGGSDPSAGLNSYMAWLKDQQVQQVQETARQKEQAVTSTTLRRDELLNRPGYSGDVNVGPAQERTAATLDKSMQGLGAKDPAKIAYDAAIAKQGVDTEHMWRVVSGIQYQAEDALSAITKGGGDPQSQLAAIAALKQQYNFLDTTALEEDLRKRAAAPVTDYSSNPNPTAGTGQG